MMSLDEFLEQQTKENSPNDIVSKNFHSKKVDQNEVSYYIENITWLRGNMKFISSVEQDISRVSEANEWDILLSTSVYFRNIHKKNLNFHCKQSR